MRFVQVDQHNASARCCRCNPHNLRQPVLVGTRTIQDSAMLARQPEQLSVPFRLLNGCQDAGEADVVALAGQYGAVTVATNMAGRGTDIKLGSGVSALRGLRVYRMRASRINSRRSARDHRLDEVVSTYAGKTLS